MGQDISIRIAIESDCDSIWEIIRKVIRKGDTYVFDPSSSKTKMINYWFDSEKRPHVAIYDGEIAGTFILKANQPDLGAHIANASYMVSPKYEGKGIGKAMAKYSIEEARQLGFHAMQYNLVVKTNIRAIALWEKLGFEVIGEIPDAFNHQSAGLTNALIMYLKL